MRSSTCLAASTVAWALCLALPALGQDPATPPADPAPAPSAWSVGPIDFSGLIDGYYSANLNHPASKTNQLRNFDVKANQFSLNMAKVVLEHSADPVGFRLDLGFGRAFELIHGAEQGHDAFRNILQAYVSYKPEKGKGFQVDFGKFVTSAGAEVIETHSNWNYSRSILFAWAIPYYHFGVRTSMPVNKYFTAGVQLVNGWNNVEDNNSGKTIGLTGALATSKVSWYNNYYAGPEKVDQNEGWRHLYDTTVLLTPSPKANLYVNFDYGVDKIAGAGSSKWYGVAGAAKLSPNDWFSFSPRLEWFKDRDGFSTGVAQELKEVTLTAEFKMKEGILSRVEYRRDWSDQPFFDRGSTPGVYKHQDTFLVGFVAYFGPKR